MEKPRGFIHWTNKHSYYDELGLLVVGKIKIPVAFILGVYGVIMAVLLVGGIVVTMSHPSNNDGIDGNADVSGFFPLLYGLIPVLVVGALIGVSAFCRWTVEAFKRANTD